ncbi:MAG: hypothetical protein ACLQVN_14720 [Bryobacteraceae bacterium]
MSSVSSINPGVADLIQNLSNLGSPVVSSAAGISALENASPADLVQLSTAATQLEGVDAMFEISTGSNAGASGTNLEDLLAGAVESAATASTGADSPTALPADQLANYQTTLQASETQALLGGGASGLSGSLFDAIA